MTDDAQRIQRLDDLVQQLDRRLRAHELLIEALLTELKAEQWDRLVRDLEVGLATHRNVLAEEGGELMQFWIDLFRQALRDNSLPQRPHGSFPGWFQGVVYGRSEPPGAPSPIEPSPEGGPSGRGGS